ncbi:hypothetical protein [Minwuia sp.]|uniref:hypothetical protein n=1 Tax=Minwuia sp. TaxID=2493630 RepID=UPI003A95B77C
MFRIISLLALSAFLAACAATRPAFQPPLAPDQLAIGNQTYRVPLSPGSCPLGIDDPLEARILKIAHRKLGRRLKVHLVHMNCDGLREAQRTGDLKTIEFRIWGEPLVSGRVASATPENVLRFESTRSLFSDINDSERANARKALLDAIDESARSRSTEILCLHPAASARSVGGEVCLAETDTNDPTMIDMSGSVRMLNQHFVVAVVARFPGDGVRGPTFSEAEAMLDQMVLLKWSKTVPAS